MNLTRLRALGLGLALILSVVGMPAPASAAASAIDERYRSEPALRQALGEGSGKEFSVAGGRSRNYQWGSLYWSAETGVHETHGAIRRRYQQLGGPAGQLGFPTVDEGRVYLKSDVPVQALGARSDFENGAIVWNKETRRTAWMSKPIAEALPYHTFPYYGMPTADEAPAKGDSRMLELGTERMYSTSAGVFHLHAGYPYGSNGIVAKYIAKGADVGFLGLPTSDEYEPIETTADYPTTGRARNFEGGRIYQCGVLLGECETGEAYEVHGAILWRLDIEGGIAKLGYPTTDELSAPGGRVSRFERGEIFWNSTTKKTTVTFY